MQINGSKPPEKQDSVIKGQKVGKPDQAPDKVGAEKTAPVDTVNLSGKAKGMAEMLAAMNQLPEVRAEKVQAIEKAVNNGTYRVDPYKIASKMIDEVV
ncbi:MAG: flagellar biosynthesis anti-sigma factor FlgM [Nitrospirales bacterium]|nr:flagellar biosynthesis anti-sigma factor FlgM [Nitrospirales bacterium]